LRISDTIVVNRVLKEQIMKESVVYQDILAQGEVKGIQKGETNLVLKLLNRRLEDIPVNLTEQIREMSVEQLENLGEALLDFQSLEALVDWLAR
jgi:predicted transposase YdaD